MTDKKKPLQVPPELKKITAFVRRAEELQADTSQAASRLVAFYCRQYAVHTGIPLATTAAGKECLGQLLASLETEKSAMDAFTRDEAAFLCRQFAESVFNKADQEDRAGQATKTTAKTFYAAATFGQILEQFADAESDEFAQDRKKVVYAKWKATEILNALKRGEQPAPGGYNNQSKDEAEVDEEEEPDVALPPPPPAAATEEIEITATQDDQEEPDIAALPPPPAVAPSSSSEVGQEVEYGQPPPPAYPGPASAPPPALPVAPPKKKGLFGFGTTKVSSSKEQLRDATELTRFALAALEDKDATLAAKRLREALKALGQQ